VSKRSKRESSLFWSFMSAARKGGGGGRGVSSLGRCGVGTERCRRVRFGQNGGSQLSYCETVLNSAFLVTLPFLRVENINKYW
jgi:hypothetical protein